MPMRSSTAFPFGAAGDICIPCAVDDPVGEGSAAGRAGWLAVQPQAPSRRALTKIHPAPGTRPLIGAATRIRPERAARVPPMPLARVPIEVRLNVILPWQRLTCNAWLATQHLRRMIGTSQPAASGPSSGMRLRSSSPSPPPWLPSASGGSATAACPDRPPGAA